MKFKTMEELRALLPDGEKPQAPDVGTPNGHDGRRQVVRLRIDRRGRKGKTVTLVTGLRHNPDTLKEIARDLKEKCGSGGTVRDGTIELQGDQRLRAKEELEKMNYVVK